MKIIKKISNDKNKIIIYKKKNKIFVDKIFKKKIFFIKMKYRANYFKKKVF